jgi:hypothetical protein
VQGTWSQGIRPAQNGTRNQEMMDFQEGTSAETEMQPWHKGLRPKTAATRQQANKGPRRQMATISEEGEDNREWY